MVHQLAARQTILELEEGRGWLQSATDSAGKLLKTHLEGQFSDIVEREAVRLGVRFQVQSKWTSFVAVEKKEGQRDKQIGEAINEDFECLGEKCCEGSSVDFGCLDVPPPAPNPYALVPQPTGFVPYAAAPGGVEKVMDNLRAQPTSLGPVASGPARVFGTTTGFSCFGSGTGIVGGQSPLSSFRQITTDTGFGSTSGNSLLVFGAKSATSCPFSSTSTSGGLFGSTFGQPQQTSTQGGSIFGGFGVSTQAQHQKPSLFGGTGTTTTSNLFGGQQAQQPSSGTGLFGSIGTQQQTSSLFGNK